MIIDDGHGQIEKPESKSLFQAQHSTKGPRTNTKFGLPPTTTHSPGVLKRKFKEDLKEILERESIGDFKQDLLTNL